MQHRPAATGTGARWRSAPAPGSKAQLGSRALVEAQRQGGPRPGVKAQNGELRRQRVDREANRRWPLPVACPKSSVESTPRVAGEGGLGGSWSQWPPTLLGPQCMPFGAFCPDPPGPAGGLSSLACWASAAGLVFSPNQLLLPGPASPHQALGPPAPWRSFPPLGAPSSQPAGRPLPLRSGACVGLSGCGQRLIFSRLGGLCFSAGTCWP